MSALLLLVAAAAAAEPATAWPCPVASCAWAPVGPGLDLDPASHTRVTAKSPLKATLAPDTQTIGLVLLPVAGDVNGAFARVTWDGLPNAYRTDLLVGRQVWAATGSGGWDNVAGVPLGKGTLADGATVSLSASAVAISVPPGATGYTVTVDGVRELAVLRAHAWSGAPPFAFTPERYVADARWKPFDLHNDGTLGLPRPAALGPVTPVVSPLRVDGERLVDASGAAVRYYGTNLTVGWQLPTPEDSVKLAKSMAALGVNQLRLYLFPTSRDALYRAGAFRQPTVDEWARFDALIDALAAHGIRIQLPLTENEAHWGKNTIEATIDRAHTADLEPIYDPRARAWQKEQIRALLGHVHPTRGVLAKDPVLAVVEISNEAGLVWEWPSAIVVSMTPRQRDGLRARWNDWLSAKYADDAALAAAWADPQMPNVLLAGEALAARSVDLAPTANWRWGTWSRARRQDLMAFLEENDNSYWADMRRFLVEELGTTALVIGTQQLGTVAASRQQAKMDLGDSHYQYDHPGDSPTEQARDSLLRLPVERRLRTVPNGAVPGQPYVTGEFNYGWPSPYEYEMPIFWAVLGARQGWDGELWYTWRHKEWGPKNPGRIEGQMDLYGNPVKMAQLPVAAAILRGGLLPEAEGLAITHLPDSVAASPRFPQPLPGPGVGDGQFLMDYRLRTSYGDEVPAYAPAAAARPVRWESESLVVDAPGVCAVVSSGAAHVTTHLAAGGAPGAVSVLGVDAVPLAKARQWLLTVATRALNTGHRELGGNTIGNLGEAPILLAPYDGRVGLRGGPGKRVTVTRLSPTGAPEGEVPVRRDRDTWWVDVSAVPPGTWFDVRWN